MPAEDDPKTHDFDQRHDGPFDQPPTRRSVQIDTTPASREDSSALRSASSPHNATPSATKPHKSVQLPESPSDTTTPAPRRSTTIGRERNPRPSQDFDIRRDGPYGRPSVTMTRRRSSVNVVRPELNHTSSEQADPAAPGLEALEQYRTAEETETPFALEPPPLNYDLWERRWFIAFFWTMILVDCVAAPIVLYFCLWYLTSLSPNATFSIVTAALGGVSIVEYFVRFWRLWKKDSTCRVMGARRKYLDWFHWNFTLGWVIIMIELIVGTVPENPPIRLLGMPLASMMWVFGTELILVDIMRYFEVPAPVRISSIPKGAQLRPAIYSMIEDVVAVDGSGGTEYREALNRRYEASHVFRSLLRRLGIFWALGAEGMAMVTTILIFTIHPEAAYVVGWSAPFIWAGVWTGATIWYAKYMLRKEKIAWAEELQEKQVNSITSPGEPAIPRDSEPSEGKV
ncbi:hypothetical protein CBER1_08376 [Cercospora berteroae]|uniref:Uncharacterized protein n=1 Tax=Cercospora berteroae TaxID=357750 RepID=A0A2S6CG87_9PEZI|nr:hypothetical protein CBER1_08376 [Cercospora berteroae]